MRPASWIVVAGLFAGTAAGAAAEMPTATAVFDTYLKSRGGEKALARIAAIERIGWIATDAGDAGLLSGTYQTCIRYPDRLAIEIDAGKWRLAQTLRVDGPFECDQGFKNCRRASDNVAKELVDTARHANKDFLSNANAWRVAKVTTAGDGKSWQLTLANGDWAEFDQADGSLRWIGKGDRARRLSEWRMIKGVSIPFRLEDYRIEGVDRTWQNTVHLKDVRITAQPSSWCTERFGTD
jgi:hypothetical protein